MQVVYHRCCGLDIHKKLIVACLLSMSAQGVHKEMRTFGTTLAELYRLRDWLVANECQIVAMESTGVYWKPIWNVLEEELKLLLVNAQHIKAVPGRKTDTKDAEWIADLLQHGLLRASFVPPRPQRELRELTRYRTKLVQERARLVNRIQKVLEDSNVKLASVATDITGVSGRAILQALLDGQQDPQALAELARGRLRSKRDELAQSVQGTLGEHHRFLLKSQLRQLDFYDTQISELDQEIARRLGVQSGPQDPDPDPTGGGLINGQQVSSAECASESAQNAPALSPQPSSEPVRSQVEVMAVLDEVTGINQRIAQIVLAELGTRLDPRIAQRGC
jgi:transposase